MTEKRELLYNLLGRLPERQRQVKVRLTDTEQRQGYVLEKLVLDLNGLEDVPAYFVRPAGKEGPFPTVLFNHSHGGAYERGKEELLTSCSYLYQPSYAQALTDNGYAALCIDCWAFGERRGRSEGEIFKHMLWHGQVMWGMMVYDSLKAVDYLVSRPDVDAGRIASIGISMGSTMAWWLAALDTRIKVCADLCCMTDFQSLIEAGGLDYHGVYYYVPNLLNHFDTTAINELICPRAHLSLNGRYDKLTPEAGLHRIDDILKDAYAKAGVPDRWKMSLYSCGHMETAAMRAEVMDFLNRWL